MPVAVALWGVAALFAAAVLAVAIHRFAVAGRLVYLICLVACLANLGVAGVQLLAGSGRGAGRAVADRTALGRCEFSPRCTGRLVSRVTSRRRGGEPVRSRLRPARTPPARVLPFYPAFLARYQFGVAGR